MLIKKIVFFLFIGLGTLLAEGTLQESFQDLQKSRDLKDWKKLLSASDVLIRRAPSSVFAQDAFFYRGEAYFLLGDYELSNKALTEYLHKQAQPKFFQETMRYKYEIARKFHQGERRHLFGARKLPKLVSADDDAIKIYDEVINTLVADDMAMNSLYYKGLLLSKMEEYSDALETFQQLTRRFPTSERAIESYLAIGDVYLKQCDPKHQDLNLLSLAELNFKHFKEAFPNEKKIKNSEDQIAKMKEIYAEGLYEIGRFYERTKKNKAAIIYYTKICDIFPATTAARHSEERLLKIKKL